MVIDITPSDDGVSEDVRITLLDESGDAVEQFTDESVKPWYEGPTDAYRQMYSIYEVARRRALGTEQVVDSILDALDEKDEVPF